MLLNRVYTGLHANRRCILPFTHTASETLEGRVRQHRGHAGRCYLPQRKLKCSQVWCGVSRDMRTDMPQRAAAGDEGQRFLLAVRNADGGWPYIPGTPSTPEATCYAA